MLMLTLVLNFALIFCVQDVAGDGISKTTFVNTSKYNSLAFSDAGQFIKCIQVNERNLPTGTENFLEGLIFNLSQTLSNTRRVSGNNAICDLNTALDVYLQELGMDYAQMENLKRSLKVLKKCSNLMLNKDSKFAASMKCFVRLFDMKINSLQAESFQTRNNNNHRRKVSRNIGLYAPETSNLPTKSTQIGYENGSRTKSLRNTSLDSTSSLSKINLHDKQMDITYKNGRRAKYSMNTSLSSSLKNNLHSKQIDLLPSNRRLGLPKNEMLKTLAYKRNISQPIFESINMEPLRLPSSVNNSPDQLLQRFSSYVFKALASSKFFAQISKTIIRAAEAADFFYKRNFKIAVTLGKKHPAVFARKIADTVRSKAGDKPLSFYTQIIINSVARFLIKHGFLRHDNVKEFAQAYYKAVNRISELITPNGLPTSYLKVLVEANYQFLDDKVLLNLNMSDSLLSLSIKELVNEFGFSSQVGFNSSTSVLLHHLSPNIFSPRALASDKTTIRVRTLSTEILRNVTSSNRLGINLNSLVENIISMTFEIHQQNSGLSMEGSFVEALFEVMSAIFTVLKNYKVIISSNVNVALDEAFKRKMKW